MNRTAAGPIKVLVLGAAGRMGRMVTRAVQEADELEAVCGLDVVSGVGEGDLPITTDVAGAVAESGATVAVDFTHAAAARENLPRLVELGVAAVVGTTGLAEVDLAALDAAGRQRVVPVFMAPNFALGAVLMMRFAAEAARWFAYAEIIEYHHEHKRDAPSGTAAKTLEGMVAARHEGFADTPVDEVEVIAGARGGCRDNVRVHSVRMPGRVADQDVLLGGPGETLTLSHRTVDRTCFMPGVLLAIRRVHGLGPGLTIGLEHLLDR